MPQDLGPQSLETPTPWPLQVEQDACLERWLSEGARKSDGRPSASPGDWPSLVAQLNAPPALSAALASVASGCGGDGGGAIREQPNSAAAQSGAGGGPLLSLDPSYIRCLNSAPDPEIGVLGVEKGDGEWLVRQKTIGGYTEIFAIDDPEKDFIRRRRVSTSDKDYVSTSAQKKVVQRPKVEPDEFEIIKRREHAVRRSRKGLKNAVRGLRANRIFTLNKRNRIESIAEAWRLWGKFERLCSMRFPGFMTIVVIEPHEKDGFHIHFLGNRYFPVESMRLWWHRILTGEKLRTIKRGAESPGNVDVALGHAQSVEKIAKYLGKYLAKSFREVTGRLKRYACSKGITKPVVTPSRMVRSFGDEVFHLRSVLESQGFTRGLRIFETEVVGRRLIWMEASFPRPT
jgi:hypothetical protein